jgi:hypothetical protein
MKFWFVVLFAVIGCGGDEDEINFSSATAVVAIKKINFLKVEELKEKYNLKKSYSLSSEKIEEKFSQDGTSSTPYKLSELFDINEENFSQVEQKVHTTEVVQENVETTTLTKTVLGSALGSVAVILVIDNSGSMREEQNYLSETFKSFLSQFGARDRSVKIVTTDYWNKGGSGRGYDQTFPVIYTDPLGIIHSEYINSAAGVDPNVVMNLFGDAIRDVGIMGSGTECGRYSLARALGDPNNLVENKKWLAGKELVVFFLTDEPPESVCESRFKAKYPGSADIDSFFQNALTTLNLKYNATDADKNMHIYSVVRSGASNAYTALSDASSEDSAINNRADISQESTWPGLFATMGTALVADLRPTVELPGASIIESVISVRVTKADGVPSTIPDICWSASNNNKTITFETVSGCNDILQTDSIDVEYRMTTGVLTYYSESLGDNTYRITSVVQKDVITKEIKDLDLYKGTTGENYTFDNNVVSFKTPRPNSTVTITYKDVTNPLVKEFTLSDSFNKFSDDFLFVKINSQLVKNYTLKKSKLSFTSEPPANAQITTINVSPKESIFEKDTSGKYKAIDLYSKSDNKKVLSIDSSGNFIIHDPSIFSNQENHNIDVVLKKKVEFTDKASIPLSFVPVEGLKYLSFVGGTCASGYSVVDKTLKIPVSCQGKGHTILYKKELPSVLEFSGLGGLSSDQLKSGIDIIKSFMIKEKTAGVSEGEGDSEVSEWDEWKKILPAADQAEGFTYDESKSSFKIPQGLLNYLYEKSVNISLEIIIRPK